MGALIQSQLQALYPPWTMHSLPSQNTCAPTNTHTHRTYILSPLSKYTLFDIKHTLSLCPKRSLRSGNLPYIWKSLRSSSLSCYVKRNPTQIQGEQASILGHGKAYVSLMTALLTLRSILFAFAGCIGIQWTRW